MNLKLFDQSLPTVIKKCKGQRMQRTKGNNDETRGACANRGVRCEDRRHDTRMQGSREGIERCTRHCGSVAANPDAQLKEQLLNEISNLFSTRHRPYTCEVAFERCKRKDLVACLKVGDKCVCCFELRCNLTKVLRTREERSDTGWRRGTRLRAKNDGIDGVLNFAHVREQRWSNATSLSLSRSLIDSSRVQCCKSRAQLCKFRCRSICTSRGSLDGAKHAFKEKTTARTLDSQERLLERRAITPREEIDGKFLIDASS